MLLRNILTWLIMTVAITNFTTANDMQSPLSKEVLESKPLLMSLDEANQSKQGAFKLCLGGQDLNSLPPFLSELKNLHYLNIAQNAIAILPEDFGDLQYLQELNLTTNSIQRLPDSFSKLQHLKWLDISSNEKLQYSSLLVLSKLSNLEFLDLSYCNISNLPQSFAKLISLKEIYLIGNKIPMAEQQKIKKNLPNAKIFF